MYIVFNEELLRKKVSAYRKFALFLTIIVTVGMGFFGVQSYLNAKNILSDYSTINAVVTSADHREEKGKKGFNKDIYEISYTFNLDDKDYKASFNTNVEKFEQYKRNGKIEIAYSKKNPSNFDRYELLRHQADHRDLARRIALIFVFTYLFFSIFVWIAKSKLKKLIGQPMEVD